MPIINQKSKPVKDSRKRRYSSKSNNENYKAVYNTQTWKKLRLQYLAENPLCKRCLEKGKYILAKEVHHKIEISKGKDLVEKRTLGFNWDNLEGLCEQCHIEHHKHKNN